MSPRFIMVILITEIHGAVNGDAPCRLGQTWHTPTSSSLPAARFVAHLSLSSVACVGSSSHVSLYSG